MTDSNSLYEEGQTIWLAWVFENNPGLHKTSGTPGNAVSSQYWASQMPEEFGSSSSSSYKYSICANYTAAYQQQEIELIGNPYMFTARAYDIETGLYYYRARYYNPYIGRFLQIYPAYSSMNLYAYCGNNPLNCVDPSGLSYFAFLDISYVIDNSLGFDPGMLYFAWINTETDADYLSLAPSKIEIIKTFLNLNEWYKWAGGDGDNKGYFAKGEGHAKGWDMTKQTGYTLSRRWIPMEHNENGKITIRYTQDDFFWILTAMRYLSYAVDEILVKIESSLNKGYNIDIIENYKRGRLGYDYYQITNNTFKLYWDPRDMSTVDDPLDNISGYEKVPGLVRITHELYHAYDYLSDGIIIDAESYIEAMKLESWMRKAFKYKVPGWSNLIPERYYP